MNRRLPIEHLAVVVPARDEQGTIDASLSSIRTAMRFLPSGITSSFVVVADQCADATEAAARLRARPGVDLVVTTGKGQPGCVGAARRLGTRVAIDAGPSADRLWIASTDADTIVPAEWLQVHLAVARSGAVALAGVVELLDDTDDSPAYRARHRSLYGSGSGDTHPHVHGANLGFRADEYECVGGWSDLVSGEDHDLWNRLRACGNVVSSRRATVLTSSRRRGRAPAGFAADLVELDASIA